MGSSCTRVVTTPATGSIVKSFLDEDERPANPLAVV
jgi:hypothetical protein